MHQYFVIGPFEDGFFYVAYRYAFAQGIAMPVLQCTSESAAVEQCNLLNKKNCAAQESSAA